MEKRHEEIIDYINNCYVNDSFDKNKFEFYQLRSERKKNRIGIYKPEEGDYFFKIIDANEFNDEDVIKEKINPYFKIANNYGYKQFDDRIINLYERLDTFKINSFNYLRDDKVTFDEKSSVINEFFGNYIKLQDKYLSKGKMLGDRLSDMWFQTRAKADGRSTAYYGKNMCDLLEVVKTRFPEYYPMYEEFILNLPNYLNEHRDIMISYTHGDFHDFNFSLQGIFWDIDTFGYNPILNDFSIYYWHFYGREDGLIYAHSPWLTPNMHNKLTPNGLEEVRKLKESVILKWYDSIEAAYSENNIADNISEEFTFKLFCRAFLIDNILKKYTDEEIEKVIKLFAHFLKNKKENVKQLLFTSGIKF